MSGVLRQRGVSVTLQFKQTRFRCLFGFEVDDFLDTGGAGRALDTEGEDMIGESVT